MNDSALILDVSSILYRSFYKLGNMKNSKGFPTGALFGFVKAVLSLTDKFNPQYIIGCLDGPRSALKRREIFDKYKSHRDEMPDSLLLQAKRLEELLSSMGITVLEHTGYEADDIIASTVEFFHKKGVNSVVVTSDKDLLQLVPKAKLYIKDEIIDNIEQVKDYIGVYPDKIVDLFALMGDSSDGIPGVKGVGPKTAQNLFNEFSSLDDILSNLDKVTPITLREKIATHIELIEISRELAKLYLLPIENIEKYSGYRESFKTLLQELEFNSIIKSLNLLGGPEEGLNSSVQESINILDVDKIILDKDSALLYEDGKYHIFIDDVIQRSSDIDFNNFKIHTYNAKEIYKQKKVFELDIDVMIAFHLLYPEERATFDRIVKKIYNLETSLEIRCKYLLDIAKILRDNLIQQSLLDVYMDIEKPMISVLANMEMVGVEVDLDYLKKYEMFLLDKINQLSNEIEILAGEKFNLASPKQTSYILFEKLQLPHTKKTKTGFSTDVEVLEELSCYEIVSHMLEYRKFNKLYNTYVLPLQKYGNRVHTTYNQDGTATGRLSSSNPNLQNIPSRSEDGRSVRRAFISAKQNLVSFDYSQIELRILAHLSQDRELLDAYINNLDLHKITAMEIFHKQEVTKEERNKAKIINFSLIYGKSAFGLSKELKISVAEATRYISAYFAKYPKVREFIDSTIKFAKTNGYVATVFGRKRFLEDINNRNKMLQNGAERMAVNFVIQGTQAEILKKAMSKIALFIKDKEINMIMQVHDELVFEMDDKDLKYIDDIKNIMSDVVNFSIPIKVNVSAGKNWSDIVELV